MASEIEALIERLEKATGPDRALDKAVDPLLRKRAMYELDDQEPEYTADLMLARDCAGKEWLEQWTLARARAGFYELGTRRYRGMAFDDIIVKGYHEPCLWLAVALRARATQEK